jgi:hypothetical protein
MSAGWRTHPLWIAPLALSIAVALPVLTHVAKLDTYRYPLGHDGPRVRHHVGLFVVAGLAVAAPSVIGAVVSRRFRVASWVAATVIIAISVLCEAFVSVATW